MENLVPASLLSRKIRSNQSQGKLLRMIGKKVGQLIGDFPKLIEDGDTLMVCVSGGKDSYALLDVLMDLQPRAPVSFELIAVNIDQGWPGYDTAKIAEHLESVGVRYRMINENYASIVESMLRPGQTPCSLCSRFRRGVLYNLAQDLGCTKIVLGHHADDLIETLVMNLFYSGQLASMPPVLYSDDGRNTVIRPLALVPESLLVAYNEKRKFPVVRCGCPSCGLPAQKRQVIKRLLDTLEGENPQLKTQMLAALRNVVPDHLMDPSIKRASSDNSAKDLPSKAI
ncbi:MAG: tRNA 2-thiocytidine(32) synthetase TtcA [Kofleriaceae bacterium]|nr:tRNA 2-thiocytidine(32) synthetase TtcA [Kofleriaceae bacterium]